jgi:hypothetical protein
MDASPIAARGKLRVKPLVACLLLPFGITDLTCTTAAAATLNVTNCNDAGSGSLRAAIGLAHSGDRISLTALTCSAISLTTGELRVDVDNIALLGPGANALTITGARSSARYASVLAHFGKGTLQIDALRITDNGTEYQNTERCVFSNGSVDLNHSIVTACIGGAVQTVGFSARDSTISDSHQGITTLGNVSISGSTISGNYAAHCAGLRLGDLPSAQHGNVQISNSTISGNRAYGEGGWYNYDTFTYGAGCIVGRTTISNSTVAFNEGASGAGGLSILWADVAIESSIFARNSGSDLVVDHNAHVDGHNNLVTITNDDLPSDTIVADPLLLALADNGGPTLTHALAEGSPAINAGNNLAGLAVDQRGSSFARSVAARPDIGAFESQFAAASVASIGPGFTGSWFDPAQSGHGLMLEVLSDHRLLAMWFAFNPEGTQQSWFGGVGSYNGNTAVISDVALPSGGRWIPNFNPDAIVRQPWGTLTVTFTDCNHGRVDFNSILPYQMGSMELLRLTQPAGLTCP